MNSVIPVSEDEEDEKREKVFVVIWLREEWWWKKNAEDEIEREEDRKFGKALNEGWKRPKDLLLL